MMNDSGVILVVLDFDDEIRISKNRIEFYEIIERMYEKKYANVNIRMNNEGLIVEYDLVETEPEDPKLTEQFLAACIGSEIQEINNKHYVCFIPYPDF
jgi:hypothetical protein